MCWIIFLVLLCVFSFVKGWYTFGFILLAFFAIAIIAGAIEKNKQDEKDKIKKEEDDLRAIDEQIARESRTQQYNNDRNGLIVKYGRPDKVIIIEETNLQKEILAFGNVNRVWIVGKDLPMFDVISCTFTDNSTLVRGETTYNTETNNRNMVKRAFIGQFFFGGIAASIGGNTAQKTTTSTSECDEIRHDYTIIINVNSLSDPIIRIHVGDDGVKVNEIIGLMNVIIGRNKR